MKRIIIYSALILVCFSCEDDKIEQDILEGCWSIDDIEWIEVYDEVDDMNPTMYFTLPTLYFDEDGSGGNWPTPHYESQMSESMFVSFTWELYDERFLVIKRSDGEELTAVVDEYYDSDDKISLHLYWVQVISKKKMLQVTMCVSRTK